MIDLNEMLIFAKVVDEGSFTGAANALDMPKSTVSRRIAQLEKRLGARLLHRTTRRLNLTEVGAGYYARCSRIVAEAQEADLAIVEARSIPKGPLRVTAPRLFGESFLMPILSEYTARYEGVELEVLLTERKVDLIEEGIDIAVRIGRPNDSALTARKIGQGRVFCCASPAYLRRNPAPETPEDLKAHRCITFGTAQDDSVWRFEPESGSVTKVEVRSALNVNSYPVVRQAAINGLGVALLPAFVCAQDLRHGRLVALLPEHTAQTSTLYAVYPSGRYLSPKVRAFLDLIVEHTSPQAPWEVSNPVQTPKRQPAANDDMRHRELNGHTRDAMTH